MCILGGWLSFSVLVVLPGSMLCLSRYIHASRRFGVFESVERRVEGPCGAVELLAQAMYGDFVNPLQLDGVLDAGSPSLLSYRSLTYFVVTL